MRLNTVVLAAGLVGLSLSALAKPLLSNSQWKRSNLATPRFVIEGTGGRSNPLRRELDTPFSGEEVFVSFRFRYDAKSIDTAEEGNGEFVVLWLDSSEGSDSATHSGNVPNLGVHVSKDGENRFMARYRSGGEAFGPPLLGDRDFLIVGRLWKSQPGKAAAFDRLDLWVDPAADAEFSPAASATTTKAISEIKWLGFSTGAKTEIEDKIAVWDIDLAETWEGILNLPPKPTELSEPLVTMAEPTVDFKEHVFPILKARCFECHEGEDAKKGIRLDVLDEVLNQTTPRDAASSHLYELVAHAEMPPEDEGEPLTEKELAIFQSWIDEGLAWDEKLLPTPVPKTDHWSYQPIHRPDLPTVKHTDWIRTPIDFFIAAKQEALGISPAPEAPAHTLTRRLTLDITGLPPQNSSVTPDPDFVDELLSSPEYGERWGRHWLDVARWAESNGHQHNRERPYAWRYRDYVVNAFNVDKPFDQFVREQIAGDELTPTRPENLVATGFLAAARYSGNELDKDIQRNDILVDVVNTTASAFLGLTMECAQCHTHKFDPLSIRDYYRFQAFFTKAQPGNVVVDNNHSEAKEWIEERWQIFDKVHDRLVAGKRKQGIPEPVLVIPKTVYKKMTSEEKKRFTELEAKIASLPQSWSYASADTAQIAPHEVRWPLTRNPDALRELPTYLLIRGDVKSRGPEVTPGWPAVFGPSPADPENPRSALADWLTSDKNPLVARVWVNRIWQWHFGEGLVETSGDLGLQGTDPTHPELLDFLASELIENNWSTKHIHRLILNSATYRQSSQFSAANTKADPENHTLWRWTPRRLEAEAVRDSILALSDQLDPKRGGPSSEVDSKRRGLYLKQHRDRLPEQQQLFDSADGTVSCSRRLVSTTALQPLWLLNSEFVQEAAQKLSQRAGTIDQAVRLVYGREPEVNEMEPLRELTTEFGLESACLTLLNSNEFLYLP